MFIYDSTSIAFIQKSERFLKEILQETGITVNKSRFLYKGYFYPLHVVVFEGSEWGHFNAPYLQIALNRKLIYLAKDSVVRDILKHELAHYFTYIIYKDVKPHGAEFREVCRQFGFPEEVAEATMNLEVSNLSKVGDLESERVIEKVKKLFMLAQSSNAHEAELATLKANELLLRHNID
jgi:predicted SprT family Zn-dependent metalloprotease